MMTRNGAGGFEEIYRESAGRIFRICLRYMKDRDDALEMVQETFIKVKLGLPEFRGLSSPITWIHRIAVNQCLSRLARQKRERVGMGRYFEEERVPERLENGGAAGDRMDAETLLKHADPVTRRILYLYFVQGLTHTEIARILGISRVAVTRRITRFKAAAFLRDGAPNPEKIGFGDPVSAPMAA